MSLPPTRLVIKRKRNEEPVESLYVETEEPQTKRRVANHGVVFRREFHQEAHGMSHHDDQPSPESRLNQIPQVIATRPGEENEEFWRRSIPGKESLEKVSAQHPFTSSSTSIPRKFHLSKPWIEEGTSLTEQGGMQRRFQDVAVLVEDRISFSTKPRSNELEDPRSLEQSPSLLQSRSQPPRKRPSTHATAAMEAAASRQHSDTKIPQFYTELQRYAAEELEASHGRLPPEIQDDSSHERNAHEDAMEIVDRTMEDEEYVYDTYIRYTNASEPLSHHLESTDSDASSLEKSAVNVDVNGSVGYLVILEADQPLWQTYFASDASSGSEQDWNSEQDDENAENYYAADYPEEEVDSADERDEDPYMFLCVGGGSDGEEWSTEDTEWSNDGDASWDRQIIDAEDRRLIFRGGAL